MAQVSSNELKQGMKIELNSDPYNIVSLEFVKPGKGQAFTRVKIKHLLNGRVIEKTYRSTDKIDVADVEETNMRMLYKDSDDVVFMDDNTFDQISVPLSIIGDDQKWLQEEIMYALIFYKGTAVSVTPPNFMELVITQTDPGLKGDTASGKVTKPATLETGATVNVPIFINEGEKIKVDTRTGDYVSRCQS